MTAAGRGEAVERWRVRGDQASPADLAGRVGTAPFFGGGTLVVVSDPTGLGRSKAVLQGVIEALDTVAPGNGLAFVETLDGFGRRPAMLEALSAAVAAAGGEVREVKAPREGQMVRWIEDRAGERGLRFELGAAQELATRVGAFVREGDIDRRRQGRLAVAELDKLQLYRPAGAVSTDDVRALVPEAIPGSVWAFTDAVAERRLDRALGGLDRLLETTPEPVILAVLHRRVRELIETGDRLAAGERLSAVGKAMGVASEFRMERLREQAKRWTTVELIAALDGLLELDAMVKGAPGTEPDEAQRRLAFSLWVIDHAGADRLRSA
jgi:DNA polymerase III delta subunit